MHDNRFGPIRLCLFSLGLALLCSCGTTPRGLANAPTRTNLPPDAPFNRGAGRGDYLFATLRWENGEELLFDVDTGCPFTILDRSLEPRLGKRLRTRKVRYAWFGKATLSEYRAPRLFLGDTQLLLGDKVEVDALRPIYPSRPLQGI